MKLEKRIPEVSKLLTLLLTLTFCLSLFGCSKAEESNDELTETVRSEIYISIYLEVYQKYSIEPEINVERFKITDDNREDFYRITYEITYEAEGTYTVTDASGDVYTGSFSGTGKSCGHGGSFNLTNITDAEKDGTLLTECTVNLFAEETTAESVETTAPLTLKSDAMIALAAEYENDGYEITIEDPANAASLNGAAECFQATKPNSLIIVYKYDSKEAAESACTQLYGEESTSFSVTTTITEDSVLIAEYTK